MSIGGEYLSAKNAWMISRFTNYGWRKGVRDKFFVRFTGSLVGLVYMVFLLTLAPYITMRAINHFAGTEVLEFEFATWAYLTWAVIILRARGSE